MIRSMHLHKWALQTRGSKPQNLIFTGCSHKAIGKHAGLSTAQLHQEFQQQVVKAKFLWSLSSSTKSGISGVERWEKRKINLLAVWRVEIVWTATCVLGQAQQLLRKTTLVQAVVLWLNISTKPKNRTFPLCSRKVQNCYQTWPKQTKRKTSHQMTSGAKPRWYETNSKRVKRNYFLMPQHANPSLFGQLCCQLKR